ncbi:helix-hairpin-helix domain-containing protein [Streptococcus entericus]|uniref:helix-hairpin-helix domain-containing protein n=1 Tax=Streptococcus entericus TaxID=155680 RepID=UPI00036D6EEF|nr:helix-hairpin-helix domain-containing protein [Streptococcus entericus]
MVEEWIERLKEQRTTLLMGGIIVALTGVLASQAFAKPSLPNDFPEIQQVEEKNVKSDSIEEESSESIMITVDVKGAVVKEGLYELPSGSRVNDAIMKAGGLTDLADKKSVNLAQKLADEAVIYVASQGENVSVVATGSETTSTQKINLNTADEAQLQTITGIGAKKAKDIITHRETVGRFSSVDDLKQVAGIGQKTIDKIRSEITVD